MKAAIVVALSLLGVLTRSESAEAGFISVVLSAGESGSATPSSSSSFQFTNPSGSALVAVNQLTGTGSVQATTGGGVSFFGTTGVPMVLNVSGGSAYLASSSAPTGAVPSTGLAPTSPQPVSPSTGSALLDVTATPTTNGGEVLAVSVTSMNGTLLGKGQMDVSGTGWWVIGLTPGATTTPPVTPPISPPVTPPTPPISPPATSSQPSATPEPATLALAVIGLPLVGIARRGRRKSVQEQNGI